MNNIEEIEEAIEAKMAEIETYNGIQRPNSYFMLAQFLEWYVKSCEERGNEESGEFHYEASTGSCPK